MFLSGLLALACANLHRELSIGDLADRAGVSHRTLIRRFRTTTTTNNSPRQWLAQRHRLTR